MDNLTELKGELKQLDDMEKRLYHLSREVWESSDPESDMILDALKLGHKLLVAKRDKVLRQIEELEAQNHEQ